MNNGDSINGYKIIKPIGTGGAGYLYHAEKEGLEFCLKECRFGLHAADPEAPEVARLFEREVSTLRSLNHPGIPKYYDSFSATTGDEERLYLVMELVKGKNLAELLGEKRVTLDYAIKVAQEAAETLLYTHAFVPPIVHRDIKPENIVQPDDENARVKLVDFGSVTGAVLKRTIATHNTIAGTPGYAAPEIWHGKECPATDIYSLGATLLYLLSGGRVPGDFLNDDLRLDFKGKLNGTPAWLEQLVYEMTEPNVSKRIGNARELMGRLHSRGSAVEIIPSSPSFQSTTNISEDHFNQENQNLLTETKKDANNGGYCSTPEILLIKNLPLFSRRPTTEQLSERVNTFLEEIIRAFKVVDITVWADPVRTAIEDGPCLTNISITDFLRELSKEDKYTPFFKKISELEYSFRCSDDKQKEVGTFSYRKYVDYKKEWDFKLNIKSLNIPSERIAKVVESTGIIYRAFEELRKPKLKMKRERRERTAVRIEQPKQLTS